MSDGPKLTILLVEDDPADARLVELTLQSYRERFEMIHCDTVKAARRWLAGNACDVVLLDLSLPDSFGFETISMIRAAAPELPVIVLTGLDDDDVALKAVEAGTQDYLVKGSADGAVMWRAIHHAVARKRLEEELRRQAHTDPLTGVANRRQFLDQAAKELTRQNRYGRPVSLLMLDVDRFKAVNDTYGHAAGDTVLARLAAVCREELRESDLVGRLGGEEFAVLLPETDAPGARDVAERLRLSIAACETPTAEGVIRFTVSIGVAAHRAEETLQNTMARADAALYDAKRAGRDRVVVAAPGAEAA